MPIDATTQTDYLYGYSADSDNRLTYVNTEQPKANIYFKHAMARVTMRIKKSADNEKTYKFPYINLLNVDKSAYVNVLENGAILDPSGTSNLTAKPSDYALENSDNEIVADFLVIPGNTERRNIMLNMNDVSGFENGLSAAVPATNWQAGQQYTYTVTIKNGSLDINQAEISEWKNSEQGGLNVGDKDYAIAEAIDLGLSVKWASWNMGATSPKIYSDSYIWGDSTGEMISAKFTNSPPSNISGTEHDIAKARWGEQWRLPTDSEITELVNKCIWNWTTIDNIEGYQVTAENGNSIFMPAKSRGGYYMSGTYNSYGVVHLFLTEKQHNISMWVDDKGLSQRYTVRPVME